MEKMVEVVLPASFSNVSHITVFNIEFNQPQDILFNNENNMDTLIT